MSLHKHAFQMLDASDGLGARKDNTIVLPMRTVTVALVADNPGIWMMHCHNTYHQQAGMMTSLNYCHLTVGVLSKGGFGVGG